jgi:hypothetical protein
MQSKPGSPNVIYLNFDGETITSPPLLGSATIGNYFGWIAFANIVDIDGSPIAESNRVSSIKVPPASAGPNIDRIKILEEAARKYEIFDVNVTDERNVYNGANGFKTMALVTCRPTVNEYNQLTLENNRSENHKWPYSYRRFLRSSPSMYRALGLAGPPSTVGLLLFDWTQYSFAWTNAFFLSNRLNDTYLTTNSQEVFPVTRIISRTVAHEVGHKFGLVHDGELPDIEYFAGNSAGWIPIMGGDNVNDIKNLAQWDKGEYQFHEHVRKGGRLNLILGQKQNDLAIIGSTLGFIKSPKEKVSKTNIKPKDFQIYEAMAKYNFCWDFDNLGVNIRNLYKNDVITFNGQKMIEGMIGFPGDFEILKMVLPYGKYTFKIDPFWNTPESMLDVRIDLLNCHCHRPKEKHPVNCNQNDLPTTYPTDKNSNNFECISFSNCLGPDYDSFTSYPDRNDNFGLPVEIENLELPYTQIVYLMIRGDKEEPMERDGWSPYGSVGKYYLKINRDGTNNPETFLPDSAFPIPVCNCEEFEFCSSSGSGTNTLPFVFFTQEENENTGTPNQNGPHIKEFKIEKNGKFENKKFLVNGPPINKDAKEEPGKFYLVINIDNVCKKQEFIVGSRWEQKKRP